MYRRRFEWDYLFQNSNVVKEFGIEDLVLRDRNKLVVEIYKKLKKAKK